MNETEKPAEGTETLQEQQETITVTIDRRTGALGCASNVNLIKALGMLEIAKQSLLDQNKRDAAAAQRKAPIIVGADALKNLRGIAQ